MSARLTRGEALTVVLGVIRGALVGPALLAGAAWVLAVWLAVAGVI